MLSLYIIKREPFRAAFLSEVSEAQWIHSRVFEMTHIASGTWKLSSFTFAQPWMVAFFCFVPKLENKFLALAYGSNTEANQKRRLKVIL